MNFGRFPGSTPRPTRRYAGGGRTMSRWNKRGTSDFSKTPAAGLRHSGRAVFRGECTYVTVRKRVPIDGDSGNALPGRARGHRVALTRVRFREARGVYQGRGAP